MIELAERFSKLDNRCSHSRDHEVITAKSVVCTTLVDLSFMLTAKDPYWRNRSAW
jgi:hypothetical protein